MIQVELEGLKEVQAKLVDPALTRVPEGRVIKDAAKFAQTESKSGASDGAVARTIIATVTPMEARITSAVAAVVESGDVASLHEWAESKGIAEYVYPIARSTKRRGIRGRFFLLRTADKLRGTELPRLLGKAAKEISDEWLR